MFRCVRWGKMVCGLTITFDEVSFIQRHAPAGGSGIAVDFFLARLVFLDLDLAVMAMRRSAEPFRPEILQKKRLRMGV